MAKKRTALNSALNVAAGRPQPEPEVHAPPPQESPPRSATLRAEGKAIEVLKPLTTRVEPEVYRQLKILAAEQDRSLMYLFGEAFNLLFEKHGKAPIATEQPPERKI